MSSRLQNFGKVTRQIIQDKCWYNLLLNTNFLSPESFATTCLFPKSYQKYQIIQKPRNPTFNLLLQLLAPALAHIYTTWHLKLAKHYLLPTYKMKFHVSAPSLTQMVLPASRHCFKNRSLCQEILVFNSHGSVLSSLLWTSHLSATSCSREYRGITAPPKEKHYRKKKKQNQTFPCFLSLLLPCFIWNFFFFEWGGPGYSHPLLTLCITFLFSLPPLTIISSPCWRVKVYLPPFIQQLLHAFDYLHHPLLNLVLFGDGGPAGIQDTGNHEERLFLVACCFSTPSLITFTHLLLWLYSYFQRMDLQIQKKKVSQEQNKPQNKMFLHHASVAWTSIRFRRQERAWKVQ